MLPSHPPRKLQAPSSKLQAPSSKLIAVTACILLITVVGLLFTYTTSATDVSEIEIAPNELAFGVVPQQKLLRASVQVVNRTGRPIDILSVVAECGCTAPKMSAQHLLAGGSADLQCALNTGYMRGSIAKRVVVKYRLTGDENDKSAVLRLIADVVADYTVVPSRLEFNSKAASTIPVSVIFRDPDVNSARLRIVFANSTAISTHVMDEVSHTFDERNQSRRVRVDVMFDPSRGQVTSGMRSALTLMFDGAAQDVFQIPIEFH